MLHTTFQVYRRLIGLRSRRGLCMPMDMPPCLFQKRQEHFMQIVSVHQDHEFFPFIIYVTHQICQEIFQINPEKSGCSTNLLLGAFSWVRFGKGMISRFIVDPYFFCLMGQCSFKKATALNPHKARHGKERRNIKAYIIIV